MLRKEDWNIWLDRILAFCAEGNTGCYAENALNEVSGRMNLGPLDIKNALCNEIDTPEDLDVIRRRAINDKKRTVYLCFSTDVVHSGHIALIQKAAQFGRVTVGVLSDQAVASYKRFPILSASERAEILRGIKGVDCVVEQNTLSYAENLRCLKPDFDFYMAMIGVRASRSRYVKRY